MRHHRLFRAAGRRRPQTKRHLLAAAIAACCCCGVASAATITVDDPGSDTVPGKCTLLDAVAALNSATSVSACIAGDGNNDTIDLGTFTTPTSITYTIASSADLKSALALSKPARIQGGLDADGKPLVTLMRSSVSGTPGFRLLATSADLTVEGITFSNGNPGGRGGAIYASGSAALTLTDTKVGGNSTAYSGGGVATYNGALTITRSTLQGNHSNVNGGGAYTNHGTITVVDSTISGNSANGGGSYSYGGGGGLYSFNGALNVSGSTLNGNTAPRGRGGGAFGYAMVKFVNSTIANNTSKQVGGGAMSHQSVSLIFSTVSGNTSTYLGVGSGIAANSMYGLGSIFVNNYGDNITGTLTGTGNIIGSQRDPIYATGYLECDPKLGPLNDNGGPTRTMALFRGSCAIKAGPVAWPVAITTDQRGNPRVQNGSATDIGAFVKQGAQDPPEVIFGDGFEM